MGRLVSSSPIGQASGRQPRVDAGVMAAAVELAAIARRIGSGLMSRSSTTIREYGSTCRDQIVRMLALAASIEGTVVGEGVAQDKGKRVYLVDLMVGEIYVSHLHGRDEEWAYVSSGMTSDMIVVGRGGDRVVVSAAEYGLCPYGVGSGAWHPYAWSECVGAMVTDGKDVSKMVEAESEGVEIPEDELDFNQ